MTAPNLESFTAEARSFLDAHARPRSESAPFVWGEGDDCVTVIEETAVEVERARWAESAAWMACRFDAGFGWIDGPVEHGGRGLGDDHLRNYQHLEREYDVPGNGFALVGLGMIAPTILACGTDDQRERYLRAIYRGDVLACQLFSEPEAGSDLAAVRTLAVRDGDEWILNGQKVWTSMAHLADVGEILCRTDPEKPKHRGLTAFLLDMRAPGVEVRPLRQMTGGASFNEVFLTDVRVPDHQRLGAVDDGWSVALTTLMNERASIGSGLGQGASVAPTVRLIEMYRRYGEGDPVLRDRLVRVCITERVNAYTLSRALANVRPGEVPPPALSVAKLAMTKQILEVCDFVAAALGPRLTADTDEWGTFAWAQLVCSSPAGRIAGGTDEILRNVIGERVLGLPKEPKV
ncbi:MAG: acyl-CoA dehydrogenase [Acidimicrobiia bacterium]|nr:acyl-CoA dehydrogenase [Acidimicrobiia bacterium]